MKRMMQRAGAVAVLALMLSVQGAGALQDCVQFISTRLGDRPNWGSLMGEKQVTTTRTMSWAYTNFGGTFNGSSTYTESYYVGTYQMADGSIQQVRCDGYTKV